MLEEINFSKALIVRQTLVVAKASNNSAVTRDLTRNYDAPKEKISRAFLERGEHQASMFLEKGHYVDYYA
jgi:3-methyladenine DNA glycosylase Mpg